MEDTGLQLSQLFDALGQQIRRNIAVVGAAVLILIAGNLGFDRLGNSASILPEELMFVLAQLYVTRSALMQGGVIQETSKKQFLSFCVMSIVTSLGILIGFALLILPGLIVAARWFVAGPAIFVEDVSAGEGMRRSRELTRSSIWPIVGAVLLLYGCGYGIGIAPLLYYPENNAPLIISVFSYLCICSVSVCGSLMSVAAYELLSQRHSLVEVFA